MLQEQQKQIYQKELENEQKIKMHNFDQPENDLGKEDENLIILQNNHNQDNNAEIEQIENDEIYEQNKAILGQEQQQINPNQLNIQNGQNQDNEEIYNQQENEENEQIEQERENEQDQEREQEGDHEESELEQIQVDENDGKEEINQEQDEEDNSVLFIKEKYNKSGK